MDRQTLEYMNDRVKRSQSIINKIEYLCAYSKHLENAHAIGVPRDNSNTVWIGNGKSSYSRFDDTRLLQVLRPAMVQIIADEIKQLEAELIEL